MLRHHLPECEQLLTQEWVQLSPQRLQQFVLESSKMLRNLGISVVLPKSLRELIKPKLVLTTSSKTASNQSFFSLEKILDYEWKVAIGDQVISQKEFKKLVSDAQSLIEFRDQFVVMSGDELKNLFNQLNDSKPKTPLEILSAHLGDQFQISGDLQNTIETILAPKTIDIPSSLNATLRSYQIRGVQWSIHNLLNGFGCVLADDMGLGKTIQAITILLYLIEQQTIKNKVLVVVPTSLINNWLMELNTFAPTLSAAAYYGNQRQLKPDRQNHHHPPTI